MSQGASYALQNLIGATLCKYAIIRALNEVILLWPFVNSTRAKLRAGEENFDWLCSFHSRCFYANYNPDAEQLELGYLKSALLVQVS